jgi:hypothetical protein
MLAAVMAPMRWPERTPAVAVRRDSLSNQTLCVFGWTLRQVQPTAPFHDGYRCRVTWFTWGALFQEDGQGIRDGCFATATTHLASQRSMPCGRESAVAASSSTTRTVALGEAECTPQSVIVRSVPKAEAPVTNAVGGRSSVWY